MSRRFMGEMQVDSGEKKLPSKLNARGLSMIETLMALGVFTILVAGTVSLLLNVQAQIESEKNKAAVYVARNIVTSWLKSPSAWRTTVDMQKQAAFACFDNPQSSCIGVDSQGYATFALYDTGGNVIVASASASPGFTYQGSPCQGADLNLGNDQCPIAVQLKWRRLCSLNCENPVAQIVVDFEHHPRTKSRQLPLNTKALAITLDIPKFDRAVMASKSLYYHDHYPKNYATRTTVPRVWSAPCNIHTKVTSGWIDIPAPATIIANGSAWILQWGESDDAAHFPSTDPIPASAELELYIDGVKCASDAASLLINPQSTYNDPTGTNGAGLTTSCSSHLPDPGRSYELKMVARVTSCVENSAIDNNPDFIQVGLEYTLLR